MLRCPWCMTDKLMQKYHDEEWGVPVFADNKQFEFLVLESFQAGLSWRIVLHKRENFRNAFSDFDPQAVAHYTEAKVSEMLNDSGIIRNRQKIKGAINNSQRFLEIVREYGSFSEYLWRYVNFKPVINSWEHDFQIPAENELSKIISEDLKKRGFSFVGSKIIYSHLQATGIINDHLRSCFRYQEIINNYKY